MSMTGRFKHVSPIVNLWQNNLLLSLEYIQTESVLAFPDYSTFCLQCGRLELGFRHIAVYIRSGVTLAHSCLNHFSASASYVLDETDI